MAYHFRFPTIRMADKMDLSDERMLKISTYRLRSVDAVLAPKHWSKSCVV